MIDTNTQNPNAEHIIMNSTGWRIQYYYNLVILSGMIIFGGLLFISIGTEAKLSEISGQTVATLTVVIPFGLGIISGIGFVIALILHLAGKFSAFWKSLFALNYGIALIGYSVFNLHASVTFMELGIAVLVSGIIAGVWFNFGLTKYRVFLIPVGSGVFVPALYGVPSFACGWLLIWAFFINMIWGSSAFKISEAENEARPRS